MKTFSKITFLFLALMVAFSCSKDDEIIDVFDLDENEFLIQPLKPAANQEVKIVTYDCGYNDLVGVEKDGFNIEVIKAFNSAMKQPCVLEYDTISLGELPAGTYQLTFRIMDINDMLLSTMTEPFHTETKQLVVGD